MADGILSDPVKELLIEWKWPLAVTVIVPIVVFILRESIGDFIRRITEMAVNWKEGLTIKRLGDVSDVPEVRENTQEDDVEEGRDP